VQGTVSHRRLLQVDDDHVLSALESALGHGVCRGNAKTRTEANHQVGVRSVVKSSFHVFVAQRFVEVDDRIVQLAIAAFVVAKAASVVVMDPLCGAHYKVTHIVLAALAAELELSIAVQLGDLVHWDARLAVQTVNILRNNVLELVAIQELGKSHVARGRDRILHSVPAQLGRSDHLVSLLFGLLNVGQLGPATRTGWQDSLGAGAVVGNAGRGGNSCAGECDCVVRLEDHLSEASDFLVEFLFGIEELFLFLVIESGISHDFVVSI
jgi:hypothetical protein